MNKKKQLQIVAITLALVVTAITAWRLMEPNTSPTIKPSQTANAPSEKASKIANKSTESTQLVSQVSNLVEDKDVVPEKPLYQMAKTISVSNPAEEVVREKTLPFQIFASGGTGKIVDRNGNIILKSDSKNAIFKMDVSPDQSRIVVHRGSSKYDVITPKSGETIRLPQQPPGENVLGFASWNWIDDQTLLGVSAKTIPFRDDQVGTEREEPIISRSVLYLYDLKKQTMSEVALPPAMRTKTVSVSAIDKAGKVQLRPEGRSESYTDASLGWFEVRSQK